MSLIPFLPLRPIAEKILLTPANVIRGLPVKSATSAVTKPRPDGKFGFRNWWPPEYSKPPNPRMMPHPETYTACIRTMPWQFFWEHVPEFRAYIYACCIWLPIFFWFDRKVMFDPKVKETLTAMVVDDLNAQRQALYAHTQKHHDHAYFRDKGCHDGHPLGHGVADPHVF